MRNYSPHNSKTMKGKTFFAIIALLVSITAKAQFPAPTDFQFSYNYFMIGDGGYCNNSFLLGPAYCSHFSWVTPDTSATNASLSYYKVHYTSDSTIGFSNFDTVFITTQNSLSVPIGIIGWVWVTAVYSNPDGESVSSNVEYNYTLPIGIPDKEIVNKSQIIFDHATYKLTVINSNTILRLRIVNSIGICSKEFNKVGADYLLNDLKKGMYIIEVQQKDHTKYYKKIIVE